MGSIIKVCRIGADINAPGMLQANITAKVTEPGGEASVSSKSVSFSPFGVYVGIGLNKKEFETDTEIKLPVVAVNQKGARMKTRQLEYKIYRLDWEWWWEGGPQDLNRYVQSSSADIICKDTVDVVNGITEIPFRVEYPDWGKYLVMVRDIKGGHATGGVITVDWPEWRGRSERGAAKGSTELSFKLDKFQYEVGETAKIYLPKCEGGRVLLSIENGSKVVKRMWVNLNGKEETGFPLYIDQNMAPNFYVTATMIRPHKETDFDTPLRLFGVQSVKVMDPKSVLHPVIDMPDELHPQRPFTVKIKEHDNKPMTYTLAIVDEGLLDITNFSTPRPWNAMNQKEALGVKTWDMFDDVIGAFGAGFRSILSIGGDEALRKAAGKEKRFNPAVMFIGPFTVNGNTKTHRLILPNYVGSVRVMVVGAHGNAYGNNDKTVKVTSPLMLLTTLPRTLANCDTVNMPVNIFAMEEKVKNVAVTIETDGPLKVSGTSNQNINFSNPGEKLMNFKLVCDETKEGNARVIVSAVSNGFVTKDTTYIEVSNPMPLVIETVGKTLERDKYIEFSWTPTSIRTVSLQIATMPMINFSAIDLFMESYPHLCTEQLTSKGLFMLFGRKFLDEDRRKKCEATLPKLIKAVRSRQTTAGGFVYWPGQTMENEWVTSMAGIMMVEASRQGFRVDPDCLEKWKEYQMNSSRDYRYEMSSGLTQAYRLYSLAYSGNPLIAAMNRLRESKCLSRSAAYCLSSAYAETGRKDVAQKLIERAESAEICRSDDWFYSEARDNTIEMNAYALSGMLPKALPVAHKVVAGCNGTNFVTQDIAFATIAMSDLSKIMGTGDNSVKISEPGDETYSIKDFLNIKDFQLNPKSGKVKVANTGKGLLELSLLKTYRPSANQTVGASAKGLKMSVRYVDLKGYPVKIEALKQDMEFKACITVTNLGEDIRNMVLNYSIPSGWEIWNDRLYGNLGGEEDYRDIRDNSTNFYFALKKGSTKSFQVRLRSAYQGDYMLPPIVCEDMYNPDCRAMTSNKRVSVSI